LVLGGISSLSRRAMADWLVHIRAALVRPGVAKRATVPWPVRRKCRAQGKCAVFGLNPGVGQQRSLWFLRMGWRWSCDFLCLPALGAGRLLCLLHERGLSGPVALPSASARPIAFAAHSTTVRLLPMFIAPSAPIISMA
jgi:hypothetical protein